MGIFLSSLVAASLLLRYDQDGLKVEDQFQTGSQQNSEKPNETENKTTNIETHVVQVSRPENQQSKEAKSSDTKLS